MVIIGATHWLRIPLGKLDNDRYIALHPKLVGLLAEWQEANGANSPGLLVVNEPGRASQPALGDPHPQPDHPPGPAAPHSRPGAPSHSATQAINRRISIDAIVAR